MHDIAIRGGTIIDGTGRAAFSGDVAVDGGRVTAIGGKAGPARREVSADGLLVTPGWVDVHTHYDGQATWDPILAPSSWHGVTTILFGNCGVGFAPVRPHHRDALIDLMEGVEDIPGPVLAEGLKWDWERFPDFLDALERMPRTIDVAAQVPHHPLRVYVMGDRAIRREPATAEDIAEMRRLTEEAVLAGAFGFTTSRTNAHKTTQGEMVPGRFAELDEPSVARSPPPQRSLDCGRRLGLPIEHGLLERRVQRLRGEDLPEVFHEADCVLDCHQDALLHIWSSSGTLPRRAPPGSGSGTGF